MINQNIEALAREIAVQLNQRGETVSVAESTTGGLISAALLSVPGASSYYKGGSVVYTRQSRKAFLDIDITRLEGLKPLTPEMALAFAEAARDKLAATWGISELGASGPSDSPYGHPAGSSVFAVAGPVAKSQLIQTGSNQRGENMTAFTEQVLRLFLEALRK
jgi:PncC family amidohydrolase